MRQILILGFLFHIGIAVLGQNQIHFKFGRYESNFLPSEKSPCDQVCYYFTSDTLNSIKYIIPQIKPIEEVVIDPTGKRHVVVHSDSIFQLTTLQHYSKDSLLNFEVVDKACGDIKVSLTYEIIQQNNRIYGQSTPILSPHEMSLYLHEILSEIGNEGLLKFDLILLYCNEINVGGIVAGNIGVSFN